MRKVMQIFRIRKIGSLLLVLLALVAIFPVFFSVTGSLMGQKELNDLLGAVLTADSGSASGHIVTGGFMSGTVRQSVMYSGEYFRFIRR